MSQLIVRNIEPALVDALKQRAAKLGRSAEAEHREILREALLRPTGKDLKQHLLAIPDVGDDQDFRRKRAKARKIEL